MRPPAPFQPIRVQAAQRRVREAPATQKTASRCKSQLLQPAHSIAKLRPTSPRKTRATFASLHQTRTEPCLSTQNPYQLAAPGLLPIAGPPKTITGKTP